MSEFRSFAKINWMLQVLGAREDGYHDLETLFQSISLHDTISIEPAETLTVWCSDPAIPAGEGNLAYRAALAMINEFQIDPVAIRIVKRIPAGGGLGGGSSNAATVLLAMNALFDLHASARRLRTLALSLGSDVPFFLLGGSAHATGRGEVLTPLVFDGAVPLLLVTPKERVSTAEAFNRLKVERGSQFCRLPPKGAAFWRDYRDPRRNPEVFVNDLEQPAFRMIAGLESLVGAMRKAGAQWSRMTGSGSTVAGAFSSAVERDAAVTLFEGKAVVTAETISADDALSDFS